MTDAVYGQLGSRHDTPRHFSSPFAICSSAGGDVSHKPKKYLYLFKGLIKSEQMIEELGENIYVNVRIVSW